MASSQQQTQPDMSLRLVPGPSGSSSTSVSSTSTAVHAGIHDTIRFGHRNIAHETSAAGSGGHHPLQERLEKWDETRDNLKLTVGRNVYGMGVPIRTMMERKVISYDPHFPVVHKMPGSGIGGSTRGGFSQLQMDILDGNDETLDPRDFLPSYTSSGPQADLHAHMERKYGI
ncbi:hypothetical protein BCV69DRAFT_281200 [Microstroma glucosiphilum]|uniref:Proteasome maturation factor UMP1 n=1 Tax=Pseudomicrostroma glucosiphilum TaxID=1684307 RepID=A0A316UCQ9_9BASI|nr:hypothetical protein BCV69DRAFT_281200 [Pseudomicrostroma glucosiphilum]PWN22193.1 hypothetical protein BCV69DRAFT_281200 [Pseudomicrostroma glucosiphilum]